MTSLVHRDITAPVLFSALVGNRAARLEIGNFVGAAAQWGLERSCAEVAIFPVVRGQDAQLAHYKRHFTVSSVLKLELHPAFVYGKDGIDIGVEGAEERNTLSGEGFEAEDDVGGADRHAVVPASLGVQFEDDPGAVRGHLHPSSELAVFGEWLILGFGAEAVVEQERASGGDTLEDKRIEVVVGAYSGEADLAGFRGVGVDVVEVGEVGRIFGIAVEGQGVGMVDRGVGGSQRGAKQEQEK